MNPIEGATHAVRRVPWELWVGLGLTLLIAWVATRQAVSAGQRSAGAEARVVSGETGGSEGAVVQALGTQQQQLGESIQQFSRANTESLAGLSDRFDMSQGQMAQQQHALFEGLAQQNAQILRGLQAFAQTQRAPTWGSTGDNLPREGGAFQSANQNTAAVSAAAPIAYQNDDRPPSGPGGRFDFARSVAADIGTHSATDASGNTYTIAKSYADMTDAERGDANRFAHGYSG